MNRQALVSKIQTAIVSAAQKYADQSAHGFVQLAWLKENLPGDFPELAKYVQGAEELGYDENDLTPNCGYSAQEWTGWFFVRLKNDILGSSQQQQIKLPLTANLQKAFIMPLLEAEAKAKAIKQERYEKAKLEEENKALKYTLTVKKDTIADLTDQIDALEKRCTEMQLHIDHLENVIA